MNNQSSKLSAGEKPAQGVLECGGKRSATPLWNWFGPNKPPRSRESAVAAAALPAHSITWRWLIGAVSLRLGFSALVLLWAASMSVAQYAIDWSKIAGGGGTSTNIQYSLSGTIGEHDAGWPMTNGHYSLVGGFWVLPMLVQSPGAPTLRITNAAPGFAAIWWTPPTPGFTLQSTASLSPTNWINTPSGTNNPTTVPATLPARFYRVFKP